MARMSASRPVSETFRNWAVSTYSASCTEAARKNTQAAFTSAKVHRHCHAQARRPVRLICSAA